MTPSDDPAEAQAIRRREACLSKLTWSSRDEAVAARAYAGWQYGSQGAGVKPYRCQECGKWHLSRDTA